MAIPENSRYISLQVVLDFSSGDNMNFIVKGNFKAGHNWEPFTKKITTLNKNLASEKVFSLIGSEHGLKRGLIKINSVEEAKE